MSDQRRSARAGNACATPPGAASRLAVATVFVCLLLVSVALVPPVEAGFRFEAETAVLGNRFHNVGGDEEIYVKPCEGASGGLAVQGLDFPGDWIEFELTLSQPFCFLDSLRCAANIDGAWLFRVLFIPQGETDPVLQDALPQVQGRGIG